MAGLGRQFYTLIQPESIDWKRRIYDHFGGSQVKNEWNLRQDKGSGGTATIFDAIDGGVQIATDGSGSTDRLSIGYADVQQFQPSACRFIATAKLTSTTNTSARFGMSGQTGIGTDYIRINITSATAASIRNNDTVGGSSTTFGTTSGYDSWHNYKIKAGNGATWAWMDGFLEALNSSNWDSPPTGLSPFLGIEINTTSAVRTVNYGYVEAYNI